MRPDEGDDGTVEDDDDGKEGMEADGDKADDADAAVEAKLKAEASPKVGEGIVVFSSACACGTQILTGRCGVEAAAAASSRSRIAAPCFGLC